MTVRKFLTSYQPSALRLISIGLILIGVGVFLLPEAHAQPSGDSSPTPQPTRFTSRFDSPTQAVTEPQTTAEAPTAQPTTRSAGATQTQPTPMPQATRFTSMFDAPPQGQAPEQEPTSAPTGPTRVPSIFDAPAGEQPTGAPAGPTRVPSIFDAPAGEQPTSAPAGPTRIPSIFDAPAGEQPAGVPAGPTRIPSMFDSPGGQPAAQPTAVTPGGAAPIGSIFDQVTSDVIRYQGQGAPDRQYCMTCHANPFLQMELPSGEIVSVAVDEEEYMSSVHGQHGTDGYRCVRCHEGMNEYPHPEIVVPNARELTIELSTSCQGCHPNKYEEMHDDVHVALMASGNRDAAVCSDCHTGHAVQRLTDRITGQPLPDIGAESAAMCESCHSEIYDLYAESVHGSAILEGNPDAPTCADCHGVHDTHGPSTGPFRLFSPQICASCHADETLMAKYDISTHVFDTYVADFHGTTVSIFQATAPDQDFNAPVCVDCHGVHNIMSAEAEGGLAIKENLVTTCQRCHPGATTNFPDAWLSHYPPSFERTPLVAFANTAYTIAIPAIVGGLGLFVVSDIRRRRSERRSERRKDR